MKNFLTRGLCLSLFFAISIFFFESCQKETVELTQQVDAPQNTTWQATPDADLILFSKVLAKSQKRAEVREFLDTWFKKDQLGEKMVFFVQIKDQVVYGEKTFLDIMTTELSEMENASLRSDYFAELIILYPNLGFSIYTGSDDISIADFEYNASVKVIPETVNFRQGEERFENGYDENLNQKLFSNNKAPDEPAIVVENSSQWVMFLMDGGLTQVGGTAVVELCDDIIAGVYSSWLALLGTDEYIVADGEVIENPIHDLLIIDWITYNELWIEYCCETCGETNDDDDDDDDDEPEVCDRDDRENHEILVKLRIADSILDEFCKWWKTKCKVEIKQVFALNPDEVSLSTSTLIINPKRKRLKNDQWVVRNYEMERFRYLDGTHGDVYSLALTGRHHNPDGSKTFSIGIKPTIKFKVAGVEVSVSGPNAGFSWTIANNDSELGSRFVEYCDAANGDGTEYATGVCDFVVKEEE